MTTRSGRAYGPQEEIKITIAGITRPLSLRDIRHVHSDGRVEYKHDIRYVNSFNGGNTQTIGGRINVCPDEKCMKVEEPNEGNLCSNCNSYSCNDCVTSCPCCEGEVCPSCKPKMIECPTAIRWCIQHAWLLVKIA